MPNEAPKKARPMAVKVLQLLNDERNQEQEWLSEQVFASRVTIETLSDAMKAEATRITFETEKQIEAIKVSMNERISGSNAAYAQMIETERLRISRLEARIDAIAAETIETMKQEDETADKNIVQMPNMKLTAAASIVRGA